VNGRQKVVLLIVQHVVVHGYAGRNKLCYASLHHLVEGRKALLALDELAFFLGIFQLIADGNTLSGPDELGQISVKSMMRKARHLCSGARSVVSSGESDA